MQSTNSGKSSQSSLSLAFAVVLAIPEFEIAKVITDKLHYGYRHYSLPEPFTLSNTFFVPLASSGIAGHRAVD